MVFMCLVLSVFSTIDEYEKEAGVLLFYMEMVVVVWFTAEFFFRYLNVKFEVHSSKIISTTLVLIDCYVTSLPIPQVMVVRMSLEVSNSHRSAEVSSATLLHHR